MKLRVLFIVFLFFSILGVSAQQKLTIAVAANMQYAIEALKTAFHQENKTEIQVVLGASGKLTQQIIAGAPFDIFISADTTFPEKLAAAGMAAQAPKTYAQGLLVLWSAKPGITPGADLKLLLAPQVQHIAIANPKTAPYGTAAEYLLKQYNIYNQIAPKLVTGESISQTTQFIATQAADIGFTAKAIVISDEMKGIGKWVELNRKDYPPIKQAAVLLKYGMQHNAKAAKQFYDFLYSARAKKIFENYGYIVQL